MKSNKITASVMTAALCFSSVVPYTAVAESSVSEIKIETNKAEETAAYSLGDVDGSGSVTGIDASMVLSEYASISAGRGATFTDRAAKAADIDRNGVVNGVDASGILSYYAYSSAGGKLTFPEYLDPNNNTATTSTTAKTTATTTTSASSASTTTTTAAADKINKITLTKYSMNLTVGSGDIAIVTMTPANVTDKREKWESSDTSVAVVDNEGFVTAKKTGTCTVTVTSVNNPAVKAEIKVTVSDPNKITGIELTKKEMNLAVGQGDISIVTMLPKGAKDVSEIWTSSDTKVATVDGEGWVTAVGAGTCTVTVKSKQNPDVKADIKVTVTDKNRVNEIKLSKTEMKIAIGGKDISYVTMLPSTATDLGEIWTTSDPKVATVDGWGNVTGR